MSDSRNDDDEWGLSLPFDTDDPEFTRGFQVGMIYGKFFHPDEHGEVIVSAENAEMLARLIERGAPIEVLDNGDEYLCVRRAGLSMGPDTPPEEEQP